MDQASIRTRLEELRASRQAKIAEKRDVELARLPREDADARCETAIAQLAGSYDCAAAALADARLEPVGAILPLFSIRAEDGVVVISPAAFAWLLGDRLRERYADELDLLYEDVEPGLPLADRPARIAAIDREIAALENEEEQLICDAVAGGIKLLRRPDADPAVLLAVK